MRFISDSQRRAVFAKTFLRYRQGEGLMPLDKIRVLEWGDEGDVTPDKLHAWQEALPSDIEFDPVVLRPMLSDPSMYFPQEGRHRFLTEKEHATEAIPYVMGDYR